jgi:glycogen operon protein
MSDAEWGAAFARCLGMFLAGGGLDERDAHGHHLRDDDFLLLFNAHHEAVPFRLPGGNGVPAWELMFDTAASDPNGSGPPQRGGTDYPLAGRSMALLRLPRADERKPA